VVSDAALAPGASRPVEAKQENAPHEARGE
jgi:hypothetical protein